MRRILFVLLVAGLGALAPAFAAGAGPSAPPTTFQKTPVDVAHAGDRSAAPEVPDHTNTVGVQWSGDASAQFRVEARTDGGRWRPQATVTAPDGGADAGSAEARGAPARIDAAYASEPISVNDPARVRVRVTRGNVHGVRIVAVGSPPGFATPSSGPSGLAVNPLATGGLAFAAAGAISTRRGRRGSLVLALVIGMAGAAALIGVPSADAAAPGDVPFPGNPGFVSRAQWGADESLRLHACPDGPDYAQPNVVVLHHTATTNSYSPAQTAATVRGIYVYYIQGRGYCDHGYNFLVDRYGIIYEGRYGGVDRGVIGAHATNFNTGTIGIAMIGDHTSVPPTAATFSALTKLIAWKMSIHQINPYYPQATHGTVVNPIIGHRDAGRISGDGTSCPGQAGYDIIPRLITAVRPLVAFGYPLGGVDFARRSPNAIQVHGWALDPDTVNPIQVHVYIDGVGRAITTANTYRPDIGRLYPAHGDNHGFDTTVPVTQATHQVCTYAISVGNGGNRQLRCQTVSGNTTGHLDVARRRPGVLAMRGWAIDPDTVNSVPIHVYVDGVGAMIGLANTTRHDLESYMPGYGPSHGFDLNVGASGNHTVCAYAISSRGKPNITLGCARTSGVPFGSLDAVGRPDPGGSVRVRGWTLDPDTAAPIAIHVYIDGFGRAVGTADRNRPDVGNVFPAWGPAHGFDLTVDQVARGLHLVCVYGISVGGGANTTLGCKAVQV
jgi:N-acetylmuramoyl-L-alanine amidase